MSLTGTINSALIVKEVNEMKMPNFTAETSLYKAKNQYNLTR